MPSILPGMVQRLPGIAIQQNLALKPIFFIATGTVDGKGSSFSYTIPVTGLYSVTAVGSGGTGPDSASPGPYWSGGGGGTAGRRTASLIAGQVITGTFGIVPSSSGNGAAGTATTVTFPDGSVMTCPGGSAGQYGNPAPGAAPSAHATGADEWAVGPGSQDAVSLSKPATDGGSAGTISSFVGLPGGGNGNANVSNAGAGFCGNGQAGLYPGLSLVMITQG